MTRSLPQKSAQRADEVFGSFTVSRFAGGDAPASHVAADAGPAGVLAANREMIARRLSSADTSAPAVRGLTIALTESESAQLLPSLDPDAATVQLDDVLAVLARYVRAREFVTSGNPVLNRVAAQSRARSLMTALASDLAEPTTGTDETSTVHDNVSRRRWRPGRARRDPGERT